MRCNSFDCPDDIGVLGDGCSGSGVLIEGNSLEDTSKGGDKSVSCRSGGAGVDRRLSSSDAIWEAAEDAMDAVGRLV